MAWIRGYRAPGLRRRGSAAMVVSEHGAEERKDEWVVVSGEEEVAIAASSAQIRRTPPVTASEVLALLRTEGEQLLLRSASASGASAISSGNTAIRESSRCTRRLLAPRGPFVARSWSFQIWILSILEVW